jgi:CheY-like chemotaxis protein
MPGLRIGLFMSPQNRCNSKVSNSEQNLVRLEDIIITDTSSAPQRTRRNTRKRPHLSPRSSSRVFIVDDEPVIASSLAAILNMKGLSARFFTSPLEALAAARLESPDLVISDVAMPGISGVDLAIQMRAQYPRCKILLFSGRATTLDLLEDSRAHSYGFRLLQKPVHPSEFLYQKGRLSA